jgi:CubicO group peptidase (beta-lactamase class C family)
MSCSWARAVKTAWKTHRLPGIAVGIWNGGDKQYFVFGRQGFFGSPVNPETVYAIASVSKSFIAASAWMLAEEKRLNMDAPVTAYLPGFALYTEEMTRKILVKDLFSHYFGLPRHDISVFTGQNESLEETVRRVRYLQPAWPMHTHFGYSNHMFAVASFLVEKVSGMPWGEFVSERIFKPLGMKRSYTKTLAFRDVDDNYARPMANVRGFNMPVKPMNTDAYGCSGSLSASIRDLLTWTVTNLRKGVSPGGIRLFSEAAAGELHGRKTPVRPGELSIYTPEEVTEQFYGMGWSVEKFRGEILVYHGGTIPGYKSQIGFLPEKDFAFSILTNSSNTPACTALGYQLCDMCLGHTDLDWKMGVHTPRPASVKGTTTEKVVNRSSEQGIESRRYHEFPIQRKYLGVCPEVSHWNRRFIDSQKKMREEMKRNYRKHLTAPENPGDPRGCGGRYRNGTYGDFIIMEKGGKLKLRLEVPPAVYPLVPAGGGGYTLLLPTDRIVFPCRFERDNKKAPRLLVKLDPNLKDYVPFERVED